MSKLRILWACAVLSVTSMVVSAAWAQPPGGGRGGRGGGMGRGMSPVMLIGAEAVQKELGLSEEQIAKLKVVADEAGKEMVATREKVMEGKNFQDLGEEERTQMMAKMTEMMKKVNDTFLPKINEVLKDDQKARLKEIGYQAMGPGAFTDATVVEGLKITKEQQEKIAGINKEARAKMQEAGFGPGAQEVRKEQESKLNDVLTAEQKEQWTKMKGKAFDLASLRPQGGRPGGGRPGAGRPGGDGKSKEL